MEQIKTFLLPFLPSYYSFYPFTSWRRFHLFHTEWMYLFVIIISPNHQQFNVVFIYNLLSPKVCMCKVISKHITLLALTLAYGQAPRTAFKTCRSQGSRHHSTKMWESAGGQLDFSPHPGKISVLHYWQCVHCSHSSKLKCPIKMPKLGLIQPGSATSNSLGTAAEKLLILQVTCMTLAQINPFSKSAFKACLTNIFVVQVRLTSRILSLFLRNGNDKNSNRLLYLSVNFLIAGNCEPFKSY